MRQVAFPVVMCLAGCNQVSGLDDFRVGTEPKGSYLNAAECRACLDEKCAPTLEQCDADPLCGKTLAKRREADCRDPDCHLLSSYPDHDQLAWQDNRHPKPADYPVTDCASKSCAAECSVGKGWACVGNYAWREIPAGALVVRHFAFVGMAWPQPVDGVEVKVCSWLQPACEPALASGSVASDGRVELTISDIADSRVYFQFDGNPDYPPYTVFAKRKRRYPFEYSAYGMVSEQSLDLFFSVAGVTRNPDRGIVLIQLFDCFGFGADGLEVELDVLDSVATGLRPCDGCSRVYQNAQGAFSPTATQTHPPSGGVAFLNVEPLAAVVTARRVATQDVVGKWDLVVQANRVHAAGILPLTASEH